MKPPIHFGLTYFERFILAQPIPSRKLPAVNMADDKALYDRAWAIGYGCQVDRGDEEILRLVAMTSGILPASPEEIRELQLAGF
jgi:hypothetical protein